MVFALLTDVGVWSYVKTKYERDISTLKTEYAQTQVRAVEIANADTIRLQAQADKAAANSAAQYRALAVDRDRDRAVADGLRTQLANSAHDLPTATCDSTRAYATTLGAVFSECAEAIERLAGQADGHAIDSQKLINSSAKSEE
jgi:hypothetical protein